MIRSNGKEGVRLEGHISELCAEYEIIGKAIMEYATKNGVSESTLRAIMKTCCISVLDHWEDFTKVHE